MDVTKNQAKAFYVVPPQVSQPDLALARVCVIEQQILVKDL
jgi:hypothetical protein